MTSTYNYLHTQKDAGKEACYATLTGQFRHFISGLLQYVLSPSGVVHLSLP